MAQGYSGTVENDLVMLGTRVEAGEQLTGLGLNDGLLVVLACESSN